MALTHLLLAALAVTANGANLGVRSNKPCNIPSHQCMMDPCFLASCPNFPPDAQCRSYMCGRACEAEFWYNGQEVTKACGTEAGWKLLQLLHSDAKPNDRFPGFGNSGNDPAPSKPVCPLTGCNPAAFNCQNGFKKDKNGCQVCECEDGCSVGVSKASCFVRPCDQKRCQAYPQATCTDEYCGGCNARFTYNGQDVTAQCTSPTQATKPAQTTQNNEMCPNGQRRQNCFVAPCQANKCPAFPQATCQNDYCGGCYARFMHQGQDVTARCNNVPTQASVQAPQNTQLCPIGQRPHNCLVAPCQAAKCPAYPLATCQNDYCGGCNAKFYVSGQDVTSTCQPTQQPPPRNTTPQASKQNDGSLCPANRVMQCGFSPCALSTCQRYPDAKCINSNCGGCFARFFKNGVDVTSRCRAPPRPRYASQACPMCILFYRNWF